MNLRLSLITAALLPLMSAPFSANADDSDIEKIVVTGDFQRETIQTLSASASLLSEEEISLRGASYLDERALQTHKTHLLAPMSACNQLHYESQLN